MIQYKLPWLVAFILAGIFTSLSIARNNIRVLDLEAPIELTGWEYRWGDSPIAGDGTPFWVSNPQSVAWQSTKRLYNPNGNAQEHLWFRKQLPDSLGEDPYISARYIWMNVEMYLEDELFYRSGNMKYDYSDRFGGFDFHMVKLPEGAAGKTIYIRISSGFGDFIGVVPDFFLVGSEGSLTLSGIREDLTSLIIGLVIVDIGIVVFLLLLLSKRGRESKKLLFYIGLFAFCYGINYVSSHALFSLLVKNTVLVYYINSLFLLFPVGLLGIVECIIGPGKWNLIKWMKFAHLYSWGLLILLDVLQIGAYFTISWLLFVMLMVSLIVIGLTVIPAIRNNTSDSRILGIAILFALVPGLFDTLFQGILFSVNLPVLSPWGILLFMFSLAFLLDRRFSRNTFQIQNAHKLLEAYSSSLEDRVRKRTEELSEKNDQLQETLDDLRDAQNQLIQAEKMASLGQLTAGIAHEIKNPLNFVNNFASLSIELAEELFEAVKNGDEIELILEDLKMNAANIAKHGQRADRIVRSMMEHARSGAREVRPVKLNDLVEEYVNLAFHGMRAQKKPFNVSIIRSYDENLGEILLVPQEIGRVVINLCTNAFDAMREKLALATDQYKPALQIITRRNARYAEVHVRDNGGGIAEEQKDRIFEPFFTTKPSGVGTGLGLSISYDIIVMGHKGQFEVTATNHEGTAFVFRLPLKG